MRYFITALFFLVLIPLNAQKVARVIDGDTYVLENGDKVRMIGINAPEMKTEFGDDAKEHLKGLIEGRTVELKSDKGNGDKDKYGRLLRYTILNGEDISLRMVCDGYAIVYTRFKFKKKQEYLECEATAKDNLLGVWGGAANNNTYQKKETKKAEPAQKIEEKTADQPQATETDPLEKATTYLILGVLCFVLLGILSIKRRRR
ncbi:thermonuclease family protein [Oscillatoria amoena NRMC-F 0135]|nr:thermonuclease family protein [Oscillatoria amoena NRMC-F 0135]